MSRSDARFRLGATVLVVSFLAPALIPLVTASGLPAAWKTSIGGDVMLLVSFFVIGGEFWDKLRALFTQDGRVVSATALPREE